MTEIEDPLNERSRPSRWLIGAAIAVITVLALAFFIPGSPFSAPRPSSPVSTASTPNSSLPVGAPAYPTDGMSTTPDEIGSTSPSPSSGTVNSTSTPREQPTTNEDSPPRETREPVAIDATAVPAEGIKAHLIRIESVEGEVAIPGEVGGPALRVTLEVTNDTPDRFETPIVVVNLYRGKELSPAGPLLKPGGKPLPHQIQSGDSARGIYLFSLSSEDRDDVTIEVDLAVGTPIVLFQGSVE